MYNNPDPFYVVLDSSLEEFVLGMLSLGKPIETSVVGVFDDKGRGSRRDVDLPLHRDGEYSAKAAEAQGNEYADKNNIDIVGLYCLRNGTEKCVTLVEDDEIELKNGQALVFDNKKIRHGRKGSVGERILMRMWIQRKND